MIRLYNAGAVTSSRLESYWGYVSHTCLKNVRCSWQWVLFMNVCSACVWCEEVGEDWATVIAMWELIGRESMGAFQQIAAFAAEEIKRALQHSDVGAFVPAHACVVSEASQWMGLLLTDYRGRSLLAGHGMFANIQRGEWIHRGIHTNICTLQYHSSISQTQDLMLMSVLKCILSTQHITLILWSHTA